MGPTNKWRCDHPTLFHVTWHRGAMDLLGRLCLDQNGLPFFVAVLDSLAVST